MPWPACWKTWKTTGRDGLLDRTVPVLKDHPAGRHQRPAVGAQRPGPCRIARLNPALASASRASGTTRVLAPVSAAMA
jgi:membrane-bound lytic murein transglycosylase D